MKRLFILLILVMAGGLVQAQKCSDIKTGNFRITGDETNPNESVLIRTPEHQIEEVKSMGLKLQCDIKWTSDCTYELSNPKVLKGEAPWIDDKSIIYVKITKVTSSYYTAVITSNLADIEMVKDVQIIRKQSLPPFSKQ